MNGVSKAIRILTNTTKGVNLLFSNLGSRPSIKAALIYFP